MMMRPTYDDLLRENKLLRNDNDALKRRIVELEARITQLMAIIEGLRRQGKRQAAPFAKRPPKMNPEKPGRKPGAAYGKKGHREPPAPDEIDETYDAALPTKSPCCGAPVTETGTATQFQNELPRRPIHRQFDVHIGCCEACGKRVQGRHRLQTSDALGAAAAQLGPIAQAAIVWLNKHAGLSHGKIARCFKELFGINLTPSGSVQAMLRAGVRCDDAYTGLMEQARKDPWAVPDETGWRIGGVKGWLHVVVTQMVTVYVVDPARSVAVTFRVLGKDYSGTLIRDGWAAYDNFASADHQQCLGHIMRRCEELMEAATRAAARLPRKVWVLMKVALGVRDETAHLPPAERAIDREDAAEFLSGELEKLVAPAQSNAANDRLANHIWNHLDEWFTFLEKDGIDATNWRAEHKIRLGVVNRKVWGGNRTPVGARAQGVLMSVLETCRQHARDGLAFIAETLQGRAPILLPATPLPTGPPR